MNMMMKTLCATSILALLSSWALAKLPAPSDEAKTKAAEAAAKTAWAGKVDGFMLCKSQDKVVAHYKKAQFVKEVKPVAKGVAAPASAASASACVDPGPFVYSPVATAASAVAAPAAAALPASAASQAKKS